MSVTNNFTEIKNRIAGRAKLIAVSKTQSAEKILEALQSGHRLFGENRVQEAKAHWAEHRKNHVDLELHLIGPLQSNKVKEAVTLFDVIETIDRASIIEALAQEEIKQNKNMKYFIQVNTGDENQKAGISFTGFEALLYYARSKRLNVTGLMCIPPVDEDPRPHFVMLKDLAARYDLEDLSMGMSNDFDVALECGATYVRVGTALFGNR